jgi:phosphoribosylanthranilate isomerase
VSRVLVKVCGITSIEDGFAAVEAGADAIGLVFWPGSSRFVDMEVARSIAQALPPFVTRVGVFVDTPHEALTRTADVVGLDVVQLHGDETPEAFSALGRRALKALRVGVGFRAEDAVRYEGHAAGVLLDTHSDVAPGGTGMAFDWSLARGVRDGVSFLVLAGGLTPANVGQAIEVVAPDAVDVSTSVESSPGRKDREKLRAFLGAVRAAEAARGTEEVGTRRTGDRIGTHTAGSTAGKEARG